MSKGTDKNADKRDHRIPKIKIFDDCIAIIPANNVIFIDELLAYLPICKSTFYEYFPEGSDFSDRIKEEIFRNRVIKKAEIREKWKNSDNASTSICLYKLLATKNELDIINDANNPQNIIDKENRTVHITVGQKE